MNHHPTIIGTPYYQRQISGGKPFVWQRKHKCLWLTLPFAVFVSKCIVRLIMVMNWLAMDTHDISFTVKPAGQELPDA